MIVKIFFKYVLMAICLVGDVFATDTHFADELLMIGCRPWDKNIQELEGLHSVHYVDFMKVGAPEPLPITFHHVDLNDTGIYSSGKFSEFAATNPGKFNIIVVDWMTYHHIRRETAWADFATLLSERGSFIVPVTKSLISGQSLSQQTAQTLINDHKLNSLFRTVNLYTLGTMPADRRFDLLRRDGYGITQVALSMEPAIIVAIK